MQIGACFWRVDMLYLNPMSWNGYRFEKLPELQQIYGNTDQAKLLQLLGKPTINLTTYQIMYMEQTLDGTHIIELEHDDDFAGFECFSIDG